MITNKTDLEEFVGLNTDLKPSIRIRAEGEIIYPGGNRLVFWPTSSDNHTFEYRVGRRRVKINGLLKNTDWTFVPVASPFRVRFSEDGKLFPKPEVQLNLRGLKNEVGIISSLHEVGHAAFADDLNNILMAFVSEGDKTGVRDFLQRYASEGRANYNPKAPTEYLYSTYNKQVFSARAAFRRILGEHKFKKLDERNAWRYALSEIRKRDLLPNLRARDMGEHYRACLVTYGDNFVKSLGR